MRFVTKPRLLLTMGDVAGVGPEIIAKAWPDLLPHAEIVVVGSPTWLDQGLKQIGSSAQVQELSGLTWGSASPAQLPCVNPCSVPLQHVQVGRYSAVGGLAAYEFLCSAIDWTLLGLADGIVTAPLHKAGLRAAGLNYPGHTEILAERTGTRQFGMVLALEKLAVVHVTLHMSLRDVFQHLSTRAILDKIELLHELLPALIGRQPKLAVAALNPHASDEGLFGQEEETLLRPAIEQAQAKGIDVTGPWPSDTLFVRASTGEFDGVVAMYHDQGHIALKLLGGKRAVNISVGLPIVRTSVAHGTAYDIAGLGRADGSSLVYATRVASQLVRYRQSLTKVTERPHSHSV